MQKYTKLIAILTTTVYGAKNKNGLQEFENTKPNKIFEES